MTERAERDQIDGAPHPSSAIGALRRTPKDNDELRRFGAAVQKLERIGALMDALQHELESAGSWLAKPGAQKIMGAGIVGLVIKAEALSAELMRFSSVLRTNEARPPWAATKRRR